MSDQLWFMFHNQSGDQGFVVEDLIDPTNNPIFQGVVAGNTYSPKIYCVPASDGARWGKVSVIGDNPRPDEPMVKEIRYDGDEFVYVP